MFEISTETEFCAAHALSIAGRREPVHGHNFRVTVTVRSDRLDADGLVCDFHALERIVADTIGPWRDGMLNDRPPFDRENPTAEMIARRIGESVSAALPGALSGGAARGVRLSSVRVTEAPGCAAVYRPEGGA